MVTAKNTTHDEEVSLQMALIQLRWQQLRQMELEQVEPNTTKAFLPQDTHPQTLYTAAA